MKKPSRIVALSFAMIKVTFLQIALSVGFAMLGTAATVGSYDQGILDQEFTIHAENKKLEDILGQIEVTAKVKFAFNPKSIPLDREFSRNYQNSKLKTILDNLLKPLGIQYEVFGVFVILSRASDKSSGTSSVNSIPASIVVSGVVRDEHDMELPGANVVEKGTINGVLSDAAGKFTLTVQSEHSILSVSFIGYLPSETVVGGNTDITIKLEPDQKQLDEVVVVGYGEVKKSDLTGSVSSVKSADLNAYPSNNAVLSLSGRAAGVQVIQNNGSPGGAVSVRIRGTNSVQGSNEPLYVVDGFPVNGNPTFLNNSDIESLEILKDASATAIYGNRGANGVVLITTKKGKSGKTTVDYEGSYSIQSVRKKLDMMDAPQFAQFYNEVAANDGQPARYTQAQIDAMGKGTDWQNLVLRNAPLLNQSLTVAGGNDKTQFSISGSRFNQEGIVRNSDYKRTSLRANVNHNISDKFSLSYSTTLTQINSLRQNNEGGNRGGSLISGMLSAYPTVDPENADGTYTNLSTILPWGSNVMKNPLNFIDQQKDRLRSNNVLANAAITYKPIQGLSVKLSGGIQNTDSRTDLYTTKLFVNSPGSAAIASTQATSVLSENIVTYSTLFREKHSISVTGGFTYQDYLTTSLSASGSGFASDLQETSDIGSASTLNVPATTYSKWSLLSYLARANYSFNEKYLVTVSIRADGSSRFANGQKWGQFPSAALAWRLSEENFIKSISFISDLKIRAGYGVTGNTAIDPYQTLNLLTAGKTVFDDALYTTYAPSSRLPQNLKWETTQQTDVGLDAGFFSNRLRVTADYYIKNTSDLLNTVSLPSSLGYTSTIQNVGKIQNKGVEIGVSGDILTGPFQWNASANISFNRNKVVTLYGDQDVLGPPVNVTAVNDNLNILREGQPLGSFYGYKETGYDNTGKITYQDIGNPNPKYIFGFNSSMSYRNFDLNIFVQGSHGNQIFNLSSVGQTLDYGFGLNMPKEVYENHWTPENTNAKYPRISSTTSTQISNRFVEDGSYLKFKNIQLGYNLPLAHLGISWMRKAQVYTSVQNLITFTKYSWFDPEINSYGSANSIQQGMDHYSYPTAKSVTFGLKLGF